MVCNQRRRFLARAGAASLTPWVGATALQSLFSTAQAAAQDYANLNDYKALVCVYLDGGCDSHSLFLPSEPELYEAYQRARGSLAVPAAEINYVGNAEHNLGFNSALSDLADLYADGRIAVVRNLGNLGAPLSREDFLAARAWVPEDLFSHAAQSRLWQTASSGVIPPLLGTGWAGRMSELLRDSNRHEQLPLSYSFDATSGWLNADSTQPLVLNEKGLGLLEYLDSFDDNDANRAREATLNKILQLQRSHSLKQRTVESLQKARTSSRAMHELFSENDFVTTSFVAESTLAKSLKTVARMIIENDAFTMQRQLFFVRQTGWDTHVDQVRRMQPLMQDLNASLHGFQSVLEEHAMQDSVTTFTASEFARSLSANTSGTDHGWGGQYLVMGGAVSGARLVGEAPSYSLNGQDDAGSKGRFIPAISSTQFAAELARWFGLTAEDINSVFPDLQHFVNRPAVSLFKNL